MLAFLRGAFQRNASAIALNVLDHDDGIRAFGHSRAGHDFNALTFEHGSVELAASSQFTHTFESCAGRNRIRGADSETVARGAIEGRIVAIREDGSSENATERLLNFNLGQGEWARKS
jgi:hypothetical protein